MRTILAAVTFSLLLGLAPARADVATSMQDFWNGIGTSNFTGPTAFQGQSAGYYTGGNIFMRTRAMNSTIATINLPSYRAGCGGIDFFAGGFSFINSDQLVALMRSIGTNATSYAFKLALETISPMIAEQIGNLQDLIQRINQFNINSCETAKGIVGGLWPKSDTASQVICEDLGNANGFFTDRAAARHGCGSGGKRQETLNRAGGSLKEQIAQDINIAWKAIRKNPLLANDNALAQLIMTLSGTIIVRAPGNDSDPPKYSFYGHRADDNALIKTLLGGGQAKIHSCNDKARCLTIGQGALVLPARNSFAGRVQALLESIQGKIGTDAALSGNELALLNATNIPIYKIINVQTAYRGQIAGLELPQYADLIALDILYQYLTDQLKEIERGGNALALANDRIIKDWKAELAEARKAVREKTVQVSRNFNELVSVVEGVRKIEGQLMGALSTGMQGNLAFLAGWK